MLVKSPNWISVNAADITLHILNDHDTYIFDDQVTASKFVSLVRQLLRDRDYNKKYYSQPVVTEIPIYPYDYMKQYRESKIKNYEQKIKNTEMKIWQMNRKIDEIKQEKIEYAEILLNNQEYFSILNQKQKQVHTLILQNPETKSPSKIPQKKNLTQLF